MAQKQDTKAPPVYRAFFKRSTGEFTLQKTEGGKTIKLFDRLPARSGQVTKLEWVPRKSPIPVGDFRLWTVSIKAGKDARYDGIGEFFNISSGEDRRLIRGTVEGQVRWDIGLHWENKFPGSWGCIVMVDSTPAQSEQISKLFQTLRSLKDTWIRLTVIA